MSGGAQVSSRHVRYAVLAVSVASLLAIGWMGRRVFNMTIKRHQVGEYYATINDALSSIRERHPFPDRKAVQDELEQAVAETQAVLERRFELKAAVSLVSWNPSNVSYRIEWAGQDGIWSTSDDQTETWNLDALHPGMTVRQLNALRSTDSEEPLP